MPVFRKEGIGMANRIKGITVEIGGDTTGLDKALKNVAYIMVYHANKTIPATIDEWLDEFEMFSIYEILPEILELWGANLETEVQSKKTSKK